MHRVAWCEHTLLVSSYVLGLESRERSRHPLDKLIHSTMKWINWKDPRIIAVGKVIDGIILTCQATYCTGHADYSHLCSMSPAPAFPPRCRAMWRPLCQALWDSSQGIQPGPMILIILMALNLPALSPGAFPFIVTHHSLADIFPWIPPIGLGMPWRLLALFWPIRWVDLPTFHKDRFSIDSSSWVTW